LQINILLIAENFYKLLREFMQLLLSHLSHSDRIQKNEIPYRTLGETGEKVSAIGVGGFHIGGKDN
jgi:hypothetical protein